MPEGRNKVKQLEQGEAKLWLFLIGVGQYQDSNLKSLPYAVPDCQKLGDTLRETTKLFPKTEIIIYHSQSHYLPKCAPVTKELERITNLAQPEDTVLFYFSGHGILENCSQQVFLCLEDTQITLDKQINNGLKVVKILDKLATCQAKQQVIILDACHSGGLNLRSSKNILTQERKTKQKYNSISVSNVNSQLIDILQRRSAYSKGFYGLLSCDVEQLSWESPNLGHGLFSYYLIKGLQGYAADSEGVIEVNGLYKYIYHNTLQYIDKLNQQLRIINQQKSRRGESNLEREHPLQTPKLIVEAVGELILGCKQSTSDSMPLRQALVIEGQKRSKFVQEISKFLGNKGGFDLQYWHPQQQNLPNLRLEIQNCLKSHKSVLDNHDIDNTVALLYIRGTVKETDTGESLLTLGQEQISRSWLRQQIRNSNVAQQIIIFDCCSGESLQDWLDDLNLDTLEFNSQSLSRQCLIAGISSSENPEILAQTLLETLKQDRSSTGLTIASWITQIQQQLPTKIWRNFYISGVKGIIEIVPTQGLSRSFNNIDLGICPYKGLQAFREQDSDFFWGREPLTQKLIHATSNHSFIPLVGASGSGKSSVVQAGLIAKLRLGNYIPNSNYWWIKILRPGNNPLQNLAFILAEEDREKDNMFDVNPQHLLKKQLEIEALLHLGGEGFVRWLRQRPEPTILLVIDQFEELFTSASEKDSKHFISLLIEALEYAGDKFKLVITLRADFIGSSLTIPKLNNLLQQFSILVPPQFNNNDDYKDVIIKPAQAIGLQVESELVEILLEELEKTSGNLPLLQFVLEQLWQYRDKEKGVITLQSYQQQIGGLKTALEQKAEATYQSLNNESKKIARWIFGQLTQIGEGIEDTRRRIPKQELLTSKYSPKLVERVLNILVEAKLIVIAQEAKLINTGESRNCDRNNSTLSQELDILKTETTIEVAHEILINNWSTLKWWLEENRYQLQKQREIEYWAKQWQKKNQHPDFLLNGIRLVEAETIYKNYYEHLNSLEITYIKASKKARNISHLKIGGIITIFLAALSFFSSFAWLKQQQNQRLELIRLATTDAITTNNSPIIADILPDYLKITQQNQEQNKINAAKADYQQIIVIGNNLLNTPAIAQDFSPMEQQNIKNIIQIATNSLVEILRNKMLPQLESELQKQNYGELVATDFSLKENQYTGALKITYAIVLSQIGVYSDRNNDGYLTEGEEKLIPCETIKDLEKIWRKYTQNRCGWYGQENIYENQACIELNKTTLTQKIFFPPSIPLVKQDWQQRCKFNKFSNET